MTPSPDPPVRRMDPVISRRSVLASAGALAVGGVGVAAGFGLRGLVEEPPGAGTRGVSAPAALIAAGPGSPSPSPGAGASTPGPRHAFRSRPDLVPPKLLVALREPGTAAGLIFTTPNNGEGPDGPTIYDDAGEPVWVRPGKGRHATFLHAIEWNGAPALAWWEGDTNGGVGDGEFVIVDASYTEVARIASGEHADLHEFQLTPSGTVLMLVYEQLAMPDDAAYPSPGPGSPRPTQMYDCVVVELDPATGERLWQWHTADHIGPGEITAPYPTDGSTPWDPVHANSIHLDVDGNLLISARNTSCVYKVDRANGGILWRLGGPQGTLQPLDGLSIALQHDVRRQPDGTITIFDDRQPPDTARGIVVELDEAAGTARLVRSFERPDRVQVASQGNLQRLPNGNVLIGWGAQSVMTEFDRAGNVVWDASMPGGIQSYRDQRAPWTGRPTAAPDLVADPQGKGSGTQRRITAYASWNGATEVRAWRLLAAGAGGALEVIATVPRTGFETVLTGVTTADPVTRVQAHALDATGAVLAESAIVAPPAAAG